VSWTYASLLLLAVVAFLAAFFVARRRRLSRRPLPARRAARLRHPVVLAHGVLGFDEIAVAGRRHRYFRNIAEGLGSLGAEFHHPRVPATGAVAARAEKLAELVRSLPCERVNVIAHSMGGLDARYAISRLGLEGRVASLITVGTPHLGTPLADLALKGIPAAAVRALPDLTVAALERFNLEVPDVEGVAYCSVAAHSNLFDTNPLLWPSHAYLSQKAGRNDGLVPVSSQRWGTVLREIEADHWAQIGWSSRFDAVALYADLIRELVALGF
jgi:triacylglycerol lipase